MNSPATEFESLHPNARWLLRLGSVVGLLLPGIGAAVAIGVLASARWSMPWLAAVALVLAVLLAALLAGWRIGDARFARTRYRLDADGLEIHRGVFWRTQTRLPRNRVQHTDINRGPLDRRLGLATLKVYTAGTRLASVDLDGLPAQRALDLREALLGGHDDAL